MRKMTLAIAITGLAGCGAPNQASRANYPVLIPMEVILAQTSVATTDDGSAALLARAAALRARAKAMP